MSSYLYTGTEVPKEVCFKGILEPHDNEILHEGRGVVYGDDKNIFVKLNGAIFILSREKIKNVEFYRLSLAFRVNGMEIIIKDYGKAKELRDALNFQHRKKE
ncbi:MAG: hypothetical protein AB1779_08975 [Candidatus Thermoplasmatota archaeon]